ncbi:MAG TPA: DUF411 domain-containing protein [Caulobacteraceae bacterium]|nr:DUF411 domain-containing protein [Caulobacteraceae bacterium]
MVQPATASRRAALALLLGGVSTAAWAAPAASGLTVFKTPWCGCCGVWLDRMKTAGFTKVTVVQLEDLGPTRRKLGIPDAYASCHTAVIGGYALEGHVPPQDVSRLLKERPAAAGLAVPGMPAGSPGMETPDGRRQPFSTMLVLKDGKAQVFARHG